MLTPHATSEYGALRHVAMRYASDLTPDLDGPDVHPVLTRQKTTSSWQAYDPATVRTQQSALIGLFRGRGIEVTLLDAAPGCPVQHYPRDIAFVIDHLLVMARLNSTHRRPEADALAPLLAGAPHVAHLEEGTIEGGDIALHTGTVLVGLGEETSPTGAGALQRALAHHGVDREVRPVHFATRGIVHLDDHFAIVAPGTALIHRDVFPPAELRWFDEHFDLVDVTGAEARAVQANVLAIAPDTVIVAAGSDRITEQLAARGLEVLTVNYREVTRIPGSLRCTTLPLTRA
ncbi:dimethylarginine dimethylaminohydrolase family protein [Streptomyces sp. AVP053U2]|uniref:dimethylarginine dimethylaminohydrolase family protein n=1 Tax=Streptomyces sp. AVP053U2 TaxID=1737066 RepID=UPI00073CDC5B|nr:arginine deiminase family protein [Streptomyces sp. AVP053U2]ODA71621.1 N(G),N(G)-dimethylarginine dimethylaminohydrolase [Streptomyces sp. AVP053U2]